MPDCFLLCPICAFVTWDHRTGDLSHEDRMFERGILLKEESAPMSTEVKTRSPLKESLSSRPSHVASPREGILRSCTMVKKY